MSMPGLYPQSALGLKIFAVVAAVFRLGQVSDEKHQVRVPRLMAKQLKPGAMRMDSSFPP